VRRLTTLAVSLALLGCASAAPPPGGPVDKAPPKILSITPDSNATNVRDKKVVFTFDDIISDRLSRGALDQYFLISPRDGAPRLAWHRRIIEIRPRNGFKPNVAYQITKLPGLADIRGNVDTTRLSFIFSTGGTIPAYSILGRVFDWATERPAAGAIVEAISRPDSTVYITAADTGGSYNVGPFPPGTYTVRAYLDVNHNFALDRNEKWDSTATRITTSRPYVELDVIEHDTLPPRISAVSQRDSVTIDVTFDRALDPTWSITPARFRIVAPDSSLLTIVSTRTQAQIRASEDSATRAVADSIRRADSVRAAAAGRPPAPPQGGRVIAPPPRPQKPAPPSEVELKVAPRNRFQPGRTYRVTAVDARSLSGRTATSMRLLQIPRPVVDTSRTRGDTSRARPPVTRPPPGRPPK
jgi:Big-like domain-containing protein